MDNSTAVALLAIFTTYLIVMVIWYVLCIIGNWKVFSKAGEAGWKSIIPFYNVYVSYKISWKTTMFWISLACGFAGGLLGYVNNTLAMLLGLVLMVAAGVISISQLHKLSKAFGHGVAFTLGLIFFNPIFIIILGFGSSQYIGAQQ